MCQFAFYGLTSEVPSFVVGNFNDRSFTSRVIGKAGQTIGHIDATGESCLVTDAGAVPISKYSPLGLRRAFTPSFYKSFAANPVYRFEASGIGHEAPQENQRIFLDDMCVIVPLRSYQILDDAGNVVDNIHPKDFDACVAFHTRLQ